MRQSGVAAAVRPSVAASFSSSEVRALHCTVVREKKERKEEGKGTRCTVRSVRTSSVALRVTIKLPPPLFGQVQQRFFFGRRKRRKDRCLGKGEIVRRVRRSSYRIVMFFKSLFLFISLS